MTAAERIYQPMPSTPPQLVLLPRVERPKGAALEPSAELLESLSELSAGFATLDVASAEASPATLEAMVHRIRGALERGAALLLALDRLHEPPAAGAELEPVAQRVGDMCFAGTLELRRALRELSQARDEPELLVAAETACRKLRRAIQAVITAAAADGSAGRSGEHQRRHETTDVLSALAVRKLYARFRRSLRRPSDDSPAAVLAALRYAAGALAMLVGSPEYSKARLSDRVQLRCLRDRLLHWARGGQSAREGLQLLDDVRTCADLLRGVNRRQELRAHDAFLRSSLLRGPGHDPNAWLQSCEALCGLDDELDLLLEPAHAPGPVEERVAAVLLRLSQL